MKDMKHTHFVYQYIVLFLADIVLKYENTKSRQI